MECPGCSSSTPLTELETHTVAGIRYRLYACRACALHFWEPRIMPDPSFYEKVQEDESKARMYRHALIDYELRPYHKEFFASPPPPGRLLDIGCGDGKFLETAKLRGFDVWGLDLDSRSADVAAQRGLDNVFTCMLDQFVESHQQTFAVITFFEVLEHQADPTAFITQLKTILAKGGYLYGSVPNRNRWQTRQDARWDSPPHHFTRWTADSLRSFLSRQGFTDIEIRNVAFGYQVMAAYGTIAGFCKRRSFRNLTERDMVLYSLERLDEENKISGMKTALLRTAKRIVKGLMTPLVMAETIHEQMTGKGQTLVFRCRRP